MPALPEDAALNVPVPSPRGGGERSGRTASPPARREGERIAGLGSVLLYVSIPPAVGFPVAWWFLSDDSSVPWVLLVATVIGAASFLLASPLGRRSRHFAVARYRRAAELTVLVGLTCAAVVAYTVGIYAVLGFRWTGAREFVQAFLGG